MIGCVRKLNSHSFKPRTIKTRDYKNYNPEDLCSDLRQSGFEPVYSSITVESAWGSFKNIFNPAVDKYAPPITKRIRGQPCPWLRNDTKREMIDRDRLLKRARKTNTENDWSMYKRQRNRVNNLVKMNKNRYYKDLLSENSRNPKKFWSTIKDIFPSQPLNCTGRSFQINGEVITDNKCIANAFGSFFSSIIHKLKEQCLPLVNFAWRYRKSSCARNSLTFNFNPVTEQHVEKKLKQLKRSKAAGIDNIPPGILKDCSSVVRKPLAHIINMSLITGEIPQEWKEAKVVPVHKKGPTNDFDNYRPISVLPVISKIMERIVHEQFMDYLESNNLINDSQFGFRQKRSTQLAVTLLLDKVRANMDKGLLTGVVFIDLSKAFDMVSHSNPLNKSEGFGVQSAEMEWFTNYLFNRSQFVNFDGSVSEKFQLTSGVPQGSILGPLLFILYINDIDDHLNSANIIKYADDTVLFLSGREIDKIENQLTDEMQVVAKWLNENDLVINLNKGKTESILMGTNRRIRNKTLKVHFNDRQINFSSKYKYLGVLVDQTANLNEHFYLSFKKASGRLRLLKKIRWSLTMDAAESIYKCMIMPLLTYASIVTLNLNATQLARVLSLQDRAARIIDPSQSAHLRVPDLMNFAKLQTCLLVKQCIDKNACSNFNNYFERLQHEKNTRNNGFSLRIPKIKLECTKCAFYYNGAIQFNKLPYDVRVVIDSFMLFKRALKEHFSL